jgi:glycosyltransferase involved in cell wall biosynthesis
MSTRVCLVSTTHNPTDDRIFYRESTTLSKEYSVTVIGKGDSDHSRFSANIKLVYLCAPKARIFHLALVMKTLVMMLREKPDIIQCHEPDTLALARLVRSMSRGRVGVVYDVHEHYPSLWSSRKFLPRAIRTWLERTIDVLERGLSSDADAVLAVSDSVGKRFQHAKSGPVIIPNYPWRSAYQDSTYVLERENRERTPVVLYAGSVDEKRGIVQFILALKYVKERFPIIKFAILGSLSVRKELWKDIALFLKRQGLEDNLEIKPHIPYFDYYRALRTATVGVVLFQPTLLNNIVSLPNKLFDYMGAGVPVVASDFCEIRKVVTGSGCGLLVDPAKPSQIGEAISELLSNVELAEIMGKEGRKAVLETYNWESVEGKLLAVYRAVLSRKMRRG